MKITIVLGAFLPVPPVMGGAVEKAWFALAQEFARRNHEVTLISRKIPNFAEREIVEGVRHIRVRGGNTPRSLILLKCLDYFYSRRVARVLPPADIVVSNTFWLPLLASDPSRGQIYVSVGRYPKGQLRFYRRAARLQTLSNDIAGAIRRQAPSLAEKIIVLPFPSPQTESVPPVQTRPAKLLFVGRVHPEKGVHLLVESFAALAGNELADWKLVIVGPADFEHGGGGEKYFARLRQLAHPNSGRVEFRGAIFDQQKLREEFLQARIFVYPSLAARGETFGLAPLEAMAHGCAVLVSDLACFGDFISAGKTGFTFKRTMDDLVRALREMVAHPNQLERVAEVGRLKAAEFSLANVASKYLADFESLLPNAGPTNR